MSRTALSEKVLLYGQERSLPKALSLRAGPLTLLYEAGDLRYIKIGKTELVRRWYVALRDRNWRTVPALLSGERMEAAPDRFEISYQATHKQAEIDFSWQARISGDPAGRISFTMDGLARSSFLRARIGFCLLHSMQCAGDSCEVTHPDGTMVQGRFPRAISPSAPFLEIRRLAHKVRPGLWAILDFNGEIFEMEDQQNWGDASYKTFCTPLRLPYPVRITKGTKIRQSIVLTLEGRISSKPARALTRPRFEMSPARSRYISKIGLGFASDHPAPNRDAMARLAALNLSHLRLDLNFENQGWRSRLRRAAELAAALKSGLEVALFLNGRAEEKLAELSQLVSASRVKIIHWLIFPLAGTSTTPKLVALARQYLGRPAPRALFGGGTNAYFVHINRERPPVSALDLVCYSLNPQVHAFDNRSLVETLEAEVAAVESSRRFIGDLPLAVTPVTLRPRFNPDATGPAPRLAPQELPPEVDPRQMSLFGAAWTLGSLKYFLEKQVESLTYYETIGWRGVMPGPISSALSAKFPSVPNSVFPLYHVLADIGESRDWTIIVSRSTRPLEINGLAMRKGKLTRLFLANMTEEKQVIELPALGKKIKMRRLNTGTAEFSMRDPELFRREKEKTAAFAKAGPFELLPYELVRMDGE